MNKSIGNIGEYFCLRGQNFLIMNVFSVLAWQALCFEGEDLSSRCVEASEIIPIPLSWRCYFSFSVAHAVAFLESTFE